jgi:hypothetical protein
VRASRSFLRLDLQHARNDGQDGIHGVQRQHGPLRDARQAGWALENERRDERATFGHTSSRCNRLATSMIDRAEAGSDRDDVFAAVILFVLAKLLERWMGE